MTENKNSTGIWSFDGLELWNDVEETDIKYTKSFDRGAFKGTAVDALWNMKRLTERLGPIGRNWGWNVLSERIDSFGVGEDEQRIHSLTLRVWFIQEDGSRREIDAIGHTKAAYWSRARRPGEKPRYVVDEEFGKKSLTDATSKAMSWLGASADIWLGRFDGNRYVSPSRHDEANGAAPPADEKLLAHARSILLAIGKAHASDDLIEQAKKVKGTFGEQPFWVQIVHADRDLAAEIQQQLRSKAQAHGIDLTKV